MTTTPRVVATILMDDCGDLIVPAIESVRDQVDVILCIDTASTQRNQTTMIARRAAGKKFARVRLVYPDPTNEFSGYRYGWNGSAADARNFALEQATKHGDWALTIDTDERIGWNGLDLRATLAANPDVETFLMQSEATNSQSYFKERIFRLPTKGTWIGRVHEAYPGPGLRASLPYATFSEIAKTAEQYKARFERDVQALLLETAEQPGIGRWWYYLGDSHNNLGQFREAVAAWIKCALCRTFGEEGAFACYRAATVLGETFGELPEAADLCGLGLARQITPELAWYMGYLAHRMGRQHDAIRWSHLALDIAMLGGEPRVSFRYLPAWTYKPLEVLHFAHAHLAEPELTAHYLRLWKEEQAKVEGL